MNKLGGTIPESNGQWSNVSSASFSQNNFTGTIPASILPWPEILTFAVFDNALTGEMPFCSNASTIVFDGYYKKLKADCNEVQCDCCMTCH
jgi:hypothetical protein